ncbi:MAG: hypothetical protein JOS17DRAFT_847112 [Linnemannia elongata]|nr:MAG: hypothetical protein JOS17DRAFT_847112 [Linnemannia elongata]
MAVGMAQEGQRGSGDHLRQRSQEQEESELLEGRTEEPFFPQLKTLILGTSHSLSMQDLISLGVQAQFLTHVKISHQAYSHKRIRHMEVTDAAAAASASASVRHWTRGQICDRDVIRFLQLCSKLRYFSIKGPTIPFFDLTAGDLTAPSNPGTSVKIPREAVTPTIHRWACEETLQALKFAVSVPPSLSKDSHAMVWKHLGRFQNLRSLTFLPSSLVPTPTYGLNDLLTGRGRLSETLIEIRSLPSWVEDRREMVLWFAKSFPNLIVLGLMHYREEVEGGSVGDFIEFLEDKDVKKFSIYRIFIESR